MLKKMVVPFLVKEFGEEGDFFTFEGYASTFGNVDLGDDVVMKGAFLDTIRELKESGAMLPVLWQHNHDQPLGIFTELREDDKGLFVKGKLPKDDTFVSGRVIPQMKVGSINQMSIGYSFWRGGDFSEVDGVRQLHKIKLWEASLVTVPMNPEAVVTGMKSAVSFQDLPIAPLKMGWNEGEAVKRIMESLRIAEGDTIDDEETQMKFRKAFLICDQKDVTALSSYRLPVADIVAGKMAIIPFAVMVGAGAVASAGKEISQEDHNALKETIGLYYGKFGLEHPFIKGGCFRVDDISTLEERVLEKMLKCGIVKFNSKVAKTIISRLKSDLSRDGDGSGNRDDEKALTGLRDSLKKAVETIKKEI